MRIIVISDTHIPVSATELPKGLQQYIRNCDMIIHAGDILEKSVIDDLGRIADTKAVWGNMDSQEVKDSLPEKLELNVAGKFIGITHGKGSEQGLVDRVKKMFRKKMDIIIFGHSHAPMNQMIGETLFFNPGSVTDKTFAPYRSFGIIDIIGGEIRAQIVRLED